MTDYYLLLNANAPDLVDILAECYSLHKQTAGFSRVMTEKIARDGQTYFCKVTGATPEWFESRAWSQGAVIWAFPYTDTLGIGYQIQRAWNVAQCPIFYPGNAPTGEDIATNEQRHDFWFDLWQDLINE